MASKKTTLKNESIVKELSKLWELIPNKIGKSEDIIYPKWYTDALKKPPLLK